MPGLRKRGGDRRLQRSLHGSRRGTSAQPLRGTAAPVAGARQADAAQGHGGDAGAGCRHPLSRGAALQQGRPGPLRIGGFQRGGAAFRLLSRGRRPGGCAGLRLRAGGEHLIPWRF